jgi:hypothetical protein
MRRPRRAFVAQESAFGALSHETADVLLDGFGGPPKDYSGNPRSDPFQAFEINLGEAWRAHRAALLAEWRRRKGRGKPWAARFDAREGER